MLNNYTRGKIANSIALHDFRNDKPDIKGWFEYIVEFFRKNGIAPTRISNPNPKAKKTITFNNGQKKLYECNFEEIDAIELSAWDLNEDKIVFACFDLNLFPKKNSLVLSFDDQLVLFDHKPMNRLVKDLAGFFGAKYGYCYQRNFSKGPSWYPFGTLQGIDAFDDPEAKLITQWSNKYHMPDGDYKTGDLRDIYPMNVLCSIHLQRIVNGQSLKEWIEKDKNHGELEKLDDDLWAWWVESLQIPKVREELKDTGIILCI
jgi:hypothetical protein